MGTRVNIRVLGPLEAERPDGAVATLPPMQRRLLAALVIADGATVPVERLTEAMWGADPPVSARNSLQSHAARLRESLGPDAPIHTRPAGYGLDVPSVLVDARAFTEAVRRARARDHADHASTIAALRAALATWRGDPYDEFANDFAADEAQRLQQLRRDACRLLAVALRRHGDLDGSLEQLQALVARDPLHEPGVLELGHTLGVAGRVPEALATLDAYRARLADELGLDPSPAWAVLRQRLLRGEVAPPDPTPTTGPDTRPAGTPARSTSTTAGATAAPARTGADSGAATPPRRATPTLGRDRDLGRVVTALASSRLVTLVGAGGVGKTRLAAQISDDVDGPCAWIDLVPVRDPANLAPTVVEALGWTVPNGRDIDTSAMEALAGHGGLVVLDNAEHLLDHVASLVDRVLGHGSSRLLVTSRERLDVDGERVVSLGPLAVPAPDAASDRDPAVRLFLDHLVASGGTPVAPGDAARVVAAVDGLPLAIELAAARAAVLPVPTLLDGLADGLGLLVGTPRRHGDRHHTVTAVIDWSHDLLDESLRLLFRRLAVFAATFTVDDVWATCTDQDLPDDLVASGLARLVETSMVARDHDRFRLLEPLRHYATARLAAAGERSWLHDRLRDHALAWAHRGDREISGPDEGATMVDLEHALADLRLVHSRAVEDGDLSTIARLAGGLYRFAYLQARPDVLDWATLVSEDPGSSDLDPDVHGRALAVVASSAWMTGEVDRARLLTARARSLVHDPWSQITVTEIAGDLHVATGELAIAREAYTTNRALAEQVGHGGLAAQAEAGLALVQLYEGDHPGAVDLARRSVAGSVRDGGPSVQALAQYTLGEVFADTEPDVALEAFARAAELATSIGARFYEGLARTADVALRSRHGDPAVALSRYHDAITLWRDRHADGMLVTTLRNLVVLLVRVGADRDAVVVHAAIDRLADKPTYGEEAGRLDRALVAAHERLDPAERTAARRHADRLADLAATADLAVGTVDHLLEARA